MRRSLAIDTVVSSVSDTVSVVSLDVLVLQLTGEPALPCVPRRVVPS